MGATGAGAWGAAGYAHTRNVLDAGAGGLHDFHNRWYDPATGRFTQRRTPFQPLREHPYALAESNPATWTDRWGFIIDAQGTPGELRAIRCSLNRIRRSDPAAAEVLDEIEQSPHVVHVYWGRQPFGRSNRWEGRSRDSHYRHLSDAHSVIVISTEVHDLRNPSYVKLAHELHHAHDAINGSAPSKVPEVRVRQETDATSFENLVRARNGLPQRKDYGHVPGRRPPGGVDPWGQPWLPAVVY